MIRSLLFLLLLCLPAEAQAGLERHTLRSGGVTRHYLLYVPDMPARFSGPRPLVLVLHGGGGTDRGTIRATKGRFDQLAEAEGFLVLYPQAVGRMWDTGEGDVSAGLSPHRDDLAFLKAAIAATGARHAVDPHRIFATGISRGGHASYMLGCEAPGLIRAIAPVEMPLPEGLRATCRRGPPLPILLIQGTADPIAPYGGGRVHLGKRQRDRVMSAPATMALFAARNHCGGTAPATRTGAVDRLSWQGCAAPTRLDRVEGGGHNWPGGVPRLPRILGPTNTDISAPYEIWAFFRQF
ncbi:alpha/beta hydrolase family esterase [Acidimangrovimonas sediminis]|uniref:alpha/beta hydrolase family esterase n=1 Tax=Acidimangrovimonas sediminis TaxID=2056283 RepID=UPI000C80777E|nr:PHB depolymerase family esterase [Acidimangrovimonas sediminis]